VERSLGFQNASGWFQIGNGLKRGERATVQTSTHPTATLKENAMKTTHRLVAVVISEARPPVEGPALAQATTTVTVAMR
jgi:hypothetical protein